MKNLKLSTFLLMTAALVCFACKKKEVPAPDAQKGPETAITATVKAEKIDQSYTRKSTYFKLPNTNGGEIDLAAYAGKPVMVMFFTENCPYCRKAAPFLEKVYRAYAPKGLNMIGICIQENADAPKAFGNELGITFPLAYKGGPVFRKYKAQGVPFIYLLDKNHEIYEVWEGYSSEYDIEIVKNVKRILE